MQCVGGCMEGGPYPTLHHTHPPDRCLCAPRIPPSIDDNTNIDRSIHLSSIDDAPFCSTQIWFYLWNGRVGVETVAFSYERVVTHREWWRVVTASHAHFDPFHLIFNVMALWCVPNA